MLLRTASITRKPLTLVRWSSSASATIDAPPQLQRTPLAGPTPLDYRRLEIALSNLYRKAQTKNEKDSRWVADSRVERAKAGLSPRFVSASQTDVLDESAIVDQFLKLDLPNTMPITYNQEIFCKPALPLWTGDEVAQLTPPENIDDGHSEVVNEYVYELARWNYSDYPELQDKVETILQLMVDKKGHILTKNTFNVVLRHLSERYAFATLNRMLEVMEQHKGFVADICTCNIVLRSIMRTTGRQRVRRCVRWLQKIKQLGLNPDEVTWNLVACGIQDTSLYLKLLAQFYTHRVPVRFHRTLQQRGISFPISGELLEQSLEVSPQCYVDVVSVSIRDLLTRRRRLQAAFEYLQSVCMLDHFVDHNKSDVTVPTFPMFVHFMEHILLHMNNLPYAIALMNFFQKSFPDLIEQGDNKYRLYGLLTASMEMFSDSPHWDLVTRHFYRHSIRPDGTSGASNAAVARLTSLARRNGVKSVGADFNINNRPTMMEEREISFVFKSLRWTGTIYDGSPEWVFEKNSPTFQTAAKWIGCYRNTNVVGGREFMIESDEVEVEDWEDLDSSWEVRYNQSLQFLLEV